MEICRCVKTRPHRAEYHDRKVGPRGPDNADIMLVGMAPGMDEAIEGRVLCGASGQRIKKDCVASGIPWNELRLANVYEYWPPGHDPNKLSKERREAGLAALLEDIRRVKPKIIVPMGNDALRALTGMTGITNWRGSTLDLQDFHPDLPPALIIPTIHPSAVLRDFDYNVLVLNDLQRVAAARRGDDVSAPERALITRHDDEYEETIQYFLEEARKGTLLACDIEAFQGQVSCISFADSPDHSLSIDGKDREAWTAILEADCPKVWHNAMYDLTFLEAKEGVKPAGKQHDTMLLWHALYPELACSPAVGRSLAVLTSLFTLENFYKFQLKKSMQEADWELCFNYNARDSAVTYEVWDAIYPKTERAGLLHVYEFELSLLEPYKNASIRGLKIDTRTKGTKAAQTKKKLNKIEAGLLEMADDPNFNPRSWQQVKRVAATFGVKLKSTSKAAMTGVLLRGKASEEAEKFLRLMLDHRELQKAYGTYYTFDHDDDGRVRTSWTIPGTETGRMANSKSIIFKGGANLMTIPRPARQFFIADEGYTLVYADLSQAEARIVAYLAGCEGLIEAFESGLDPYKFVASWMFEKDYEDVDYDERYLAKRCVLGLLYGMGPYKWRKEMNIDKGFNYIDQSRANEMYQLFFDSFPEIREYHRWTEDHIRRYRSIWTFGPVRRRRIFRPRDGRIDDHMYREAYDYPPQGTVPDIINTGVLELEKVGDEIQLLAQIHDAWFGQVKSGGEMAEHIQRIQDALTQPLELTNIKGETVVMTIPCDIQVGQNWREYDPEDNPDGLKDYTND